MFVIDPKSVVLVAGATVAIALLLGLALLRTRQGDRAVAWLNGANLCYLVAVAGLLARPQLSFEATALLVISGAYFGIVFSFMALMRAEDRPAPLRALCLVGAASVSAQALFSGSVESEAPLMVTSSTINGAVTFWMARTVWRQVRPRGREIAALVALPFAAFFAGYFLRLVVLLTLPVEAALALTVAIVAMLAWSSIILALGLVALRERQARRALRDALARAEAASSAKSRFLRGVSHELRTPLNGVLGLSELMRAEALGALPEPYRGFTAEIHRNGARLLDLVTDLLDIAAVEAGAMRLDEAETELAPLLAEIEARFAGPAAARRLRFSVRVEPGAPRRIVADRARLARMLGHLVGNAVKYAQEGGAVSVRLRPGPSGGARFTVKDDGPGLSAREIDLALELFGRVGGADDPAAGAGVGLTLASEIARAHGAPLRIRSAPGAGAAISVALPAARVAPETAPLQPRSAA